MTMTTKEPLTKVVGDMKMKYINLFLSTVNKYIGFDPEKQKEIINESYRSEASDESLKAKKPSMK